MSRWFLVGWFLLCTGLWAAAQSISPGGGGGGGGSGTVTSIICNGVTITTTGTCSTIGQVPGTATNDSASAGNIGELVISGAASRSAVGTSATVTISIANPAVISWTGNPFFQSAATGHGCASGVSFSTTGALPTGITAGTQYYVTCNGAFTANAFNISTSVANAVAGTTVATSGTQSGTQTGTNAFVATTNTPIDFGGMSLTAGDWDITGVMRFGAGASTSVTFLRGAVSGNSAIGGTLYADNIFVTAANVIGSSPFIMPLSTERLSLSGTTTVFCGAEAIFTASSMNVSGECRARRVR